jgi:hypothetical protein
VLAMTVALKISVENMGMNPGNMILKRSKTPGENTNTADITSFIGD